MKDRTMITYDLTCARNVNHEVLDDAIAMFKLLNHIHSNKKKEEVSTNYDYNVSDPTDLMYALAAKFDGLDSVQGIEWHTVDQNNICIMIDSDNQQEADITVRYLARCLIMSKNDSTNTIRISRPEAVMTAMRNVWYLGDHRDTDKHQNILYIDVA